MKTYKKYPYPGNRFGTHIPPKFGKIRCFQIIDSRRYGWDGNMLGKPGGYRTPQWSRWFHSISAGSTCQPGQPWCPKKHPGGTRCNGRTNYCWWKKSCTIWDNLPINWCRISSINSIVKKIRYHIKNDELAPCFLCGTKQMSGDHVWNEPLEYSNVPSFCAFFTRGLRPCQIKAKTHAQ